MRLNITLALAALAGAIALSAPATANPIGAAGQAALPAAAAVSAVEPVHYRRHWRHRHHAYRNYGYRNYGYRRHRYPRYYGGYSPFYYGGGYGYGGYGDGYGYGHRRGLTLNFGF